MGNNHSSLRGEGELCATGLAKDNQPMPRQGHSSRWWVSLWGALTLVGFIAIAAAKENKTFVPPVASHAKTYPANEPLPTEHLTIAADPYDMADKAKIFGIDYKAAGFLPVLLVVSNDGDQPISLAKLKVELVTVNKEKLEPAAPEQIHRRIAKTKRPDQGSGVPLPVPFPRTKPKAAVSTEDKEEIEAAQFKALAVEPKMTRAGFFFFDVEGISNPLAGARIYVSGMQNAQGQEILYFEIPMEKYVSYEPPKP